MPMAGVKAFKENFETYACNSFSHQKKISSMAPFLGTSGDWVYISIMYSFSTLSKIDKYFVSLYRVSFKSVMYKYSFI